MQIVYREYISVRPDRLCRQVRGQRYERDGNGVYQPLGYNSDGSKVNKIKSISNSKNKVTRSFHNFNISVNSQNNLRDKINYLFQFSKPRDITTYSKKLLKGFRIAFITLTLPAIQKTPTADITKELFDPFLQSMRQYIKMDNYVWRLEFQKNGNVHYHIVTDSYIDYHYIKKRWNTIIEKHGYISDYQSNMCNMSWSDYSVKYGSSGRVSKQDLYKRYNAGKQEKWLNPNTVDVKNATNSRLVSLYISKYFSKKSNSANSNSLDNEGNSFGLRLCFWSRSLSKCKSDSMPIDYYSADIFQMLKKCKEAVLKVYDYCSVIYYDIQELPYDVRGWLLKFFDKERDMIGYIPSS